MKRKAIPLAEAVAMIPDGARLMIGGFVNDTARPGVGVGKLVAAGRVRSLIDGRVFLLEPALKAEFSLIRAQRADYYGNLEYALTARNFNR